MAEIITCPQCRRRLQFREIHRGCPVRCPLCGGQFVADTQTSAAASPEPIVSTHSQDAAFTSHHDDLRPNPEGFLGRTRRAGTSQPAARVAPRKPYWI